MGILYPENSRFPPEGSSTEGESGPKARLKSVVDGQRANIPVPLFINIEGRRRLVWLDNNIRYSSLNVSGLVRRKLTRKTLFSYLKHE